MKTLTISIYMFLVTLFLGCATDAIKEDKLKTPPISESEYQNLIKKFKYNDQRYNALYNTYQVTALILNSKVYEGVTRREAQFMLWDLAKFQKERERGFQSRSVESEFILSLYTPERSHNDLIKADSMWKIYLTSRGVRYEGKVQKVKKQYARAKALYPFHSSFSKLYKVTFNVPMNTVEVKKSKFVFTSSLGSTTFEFSPL